MKGSEELEENHKSTLRLASRPSWSEALTCTKMPWYGALIFCSIAE